MADPSALSASDQHVRSNERAFLVEVLRTEAEAVGRFAERVAANSVPSLHAALDLL